MADRKRDNKQAGGPSLLTKLAATGAGLVLILIPEPATTITGAAIVAATWAPDVLDLARGSK